NISSFSHGRLGSSAMAMSVQDRIDVVSFSFSGLLLNERQRETASLNHGVLAEVTNPSSLDDGPCNALLIHDGRLGLNRPLRVVLHTRTAVGKSQGRIDYLVAVKPFIT